MPAVAPAARSTVQEVLDEYGELTRRKAEFAPTEARLKIVQGQVHAILHDQPADQPIILDGKLYTVQATPRGFERVIVDKMKAFLRLRKAVGLEQAIELITIPLTEAVDRHIPEAQHSKFLKKERTGPRKLTAVLKTPARADAA